MSVYATIFALDEDHPDGPPWTYQRSHILPTDDGPRDGCVQLAEIPSHITRDGRDDAPEDSRPWPWARLSAGTGDAVISPGQARALAVALTAWADDADPQTGSAPADAICVCGHRRQQHTATGPARSGCDYCADCAMFQARPGITEESR